MRQSLAALRSRKVIIPTVLVTFIIFFALAIPRIVEKRAEPPDDLSAGEAVDLACFQGWTVNGSSAFVPRPTQVFVAELSRGAARDFLQQHQVLANLRVGALDGFLGRDYVVVARGTVTSGLEAGASPRGQGLALVIDPSGTVRYVGIGPPWDTLVPPNARPYPIPDEPTLSGVSRARAWIELGGAPLVELPNPPDGLALRRITINLPNLPVDPSGTEYPNRNVTLTYSDGSGQPRLWLTEAAADGTPRVLGRPIPLRELPGGVTPYAWYAGSLEIDGFLWTRHGRAFFLAADVGPDLTSDQVSQAVVAFAQASE